MVSNLFCNNRQKMYINDAELAGTTRFLSYSEVYVIPGLVIPRDDLYRIKRLFATGTSNSNHTTQ